MSWWSRSEGVLQTIALGIVTVCLLGLTMRLAVPTLGHQGSATQSTNNVEPQHGNVVADAPYNADKLRCMLEGYVISVRGSSRSVAVMTCVWIVALLALWIACSRRVYRRFRADFMDETSDDLATVITAIACVAALVIPIVLAFMVDQLIAIHANPERWELMRAVQCLLKSLQGA